MDDANHPLAIPAFLRREPFLVMSAAEIKRCGGIDAIKLTMPGVQIIERTMVPRP